MSNGKILFLVSFISRYYILCKEAKEEVSKNRQLDQFESEKVEKAEKVGNKVVTDSSRRVIIGSNHR